MDTVDMTFQDMLVLKGLSTAVKLALKSILFALSFGVCFLEMGCQRSFLK